MLSVRACAAALILVGVAGCATPKPPVHRAEPDFASIRKIAWTNTAQELAGVPADDTKARIEGFRDSGMGGSNSVVVGNLVLSAVSSGRAVTVAAQDARTGKVVWRRHLSTKRDSYAECDDDDGGPYFACNIHAGAGRRSQVWIIADRTGAVRKKIPVAAGTSSRVSGDSLYLATFTPTHKDTRLDVHIERRSWTSGSTRWTRDTSFAIDGWGHDGVQGFELGEDRVVALSASWQVIVDPATGRLLERSDQGRWEYPLDTGGRVVLDSGDGTSKYVDVTLFSADGRPLADVKEAAYPEPVQVKPDGVVVGRHILSTATGRTTFTAPRRHHIVAVAMSGRRAVVEPDDGGSDAEAAGQRIPLTVFDTATRKRVGAVSLSGDVPDDSLASGNGVVTVVQRYDHKSGENLPAALYVIDLRTPRTVATLRLDGTPQGMSDMPSTLAGTPSGVVVTGTDAVRGLVAP